MAAGKLVTEASEAEFRNHQASQGQSPQVDLSGVRVLLAEDGVDNREILTAYLSGAGAVVTSAENGRQAVKTAPRGRRRRGAVCGNSDGTCRCRCWTVTRPRASCAAAGTAVRSSR